VDALYEQAGDVQQYLTGKQIRPIIMFGSKRFEFFKDVPCSKELGYDIGLPSSVLLWSREHGPGESEGPL